MKILILKRDKLGDLLLTTPMLRVLREALPEAEIHLLANDYNAWVVAEEPTLDRRWIYRRVRSGKVLHPGAALAQIGLHLRLLAQRFDVAIVAGGEESSRAIRRALAVHARRTIAFASPGSRLARRLSDPVSPRGGHEVDRMIALLEPLGIAAPAEVPAPRFRLPADAARFAAGWLAERGLRPGGYVVLGLGARRAKKQPSTEQILRWVDWLRRQHGLATVFMWTPGRSENPLYPGDDEIAEPVLAAKPVALHPFRGPLREALGLVWNARCSLFPDSGLMHFAAASPGGVLGFFAETDVSPPPGQWGPRGPRGYFLEARSSVSELPDEAIQEALAPLLTATELWD